MRSPHWPRAVVLDSASRSDCVVSASTWVWRPASRSWLLSSPTCSRRSALGLLDQAIEPGQLLAHPLHLVVDRGLRAPQLLGAATALGRQHLVLHAQQLLDRELLGCRRTPTGTRGAGDEDEHDEQPDHDDTQQRNHEFHVSNATTGV